MVKEPIFTCVICTNLPNAIGVLEIVFQSPVDKGLENNKDSGGGVFKFAFILVVGAEAAADTKGLANDNDNVVVDREVENTFNNGDVLSITTPNLQGFNSPMNPRCRETESMKEKDSKRMPNASRM